MDVEIPANTTASIFIPSSNEANLMESGKLISSDNNIKMIGRENGYTVVEVGSGKYHFTD